MMVTRMMAQHPNRFGVFFKWRTSVWLFIKVCIFPASGRNFRLWWNRNWSFGQQQRKRQRKVYVFNPVGQRLELFSFDLTGSRESKHVWDVERNANMLQMCKASAFRVARLKERVHERTEQDANVAMMLAATPPRADWRVDRNTRLFLYLHFSGHFLPRTTKKRTFHFENNEALFLNGLKIYNVYMEKFVLLLS